MGRGTEAGGGSQIFLHHFDGGELMVPREPKNRARLFKRRFAADIHRPISAPQPEPVALRFVYAHRPGVHIRAPAMQEACGAIVAVEFLDTRDMMRLVRRSIDTASIRHVLRLGTLTIRGSEAITNFKSIRTITSPAPAVMIRAASEIITSPAPAACPQAQAGRGRRASRAAGEGAVGSRLPSTRCLFRH